MAADIPTTPTTPSPEADRAPAPPTHPPLREQLLDAAQAVILEQGIGTMTLDKVAAKANVSKGGLLHHFPSKDALVGAIVRRVVDAWRSDLRDAIAGQPEGRLRVPRAMLDGCISKPDEWTETLRNASICVVAAMSEHPKHAEPSRSVYAELEDTMRRDGTPEGLAQLVVCAMDGLWMSFVFGTRAFSKQRVDAMANCLRQVIAMHDHPAPTPAPAPRPTRVASRTQGAAKPPTRQSKSKPKRLART
jgi:AcrR family transcriptional regulator